MILRHPPTANRKQLMYTGVSKPDNTSSVHSNSFLIPNDLAKWHFLGCHKGSLTINLNQYVLQSDQNSLSELIQV